MRQGFMAMFTGAASLAAVMVLVGLAPRADDGACGGCGGASQAVSSDEPAKKDNYPLDVCVVSGEKLGSMGEPVVKEYDGRTVKFCCQGCVRGFERDKERHHKKMDELIVEKQLEGYPLETCVVGGGRLGSMGEPVNYVHRPTNQLVRFCCAGCTGGFKRDPAKYLAMVNEANKKRQEADAS